MLAWQKNSQVLTAANVKVTMNPRIRLMPPLGDVNEMNSGSYNLEIQSVRTNDAGNYTCQIGTNVPNEIVHSLEVLGEFARIK